MEVDIALKNLLRSLDRSCTQFSFKRLPKRNRVGAASEGPNESIIHQLPDIGSYDVLVMWIPKVVTTRLKFGTKKRERGWITRADVGAVTVTEWGGWICFKFCGLPSSGTPTLPQSADRHPHPYKPFHTAPSVWSNPLGIPLFTDYELWTNAQHCRGVQQYPHTPLGESWPKITDGRLPLPAPSRYMPHQIDFHISWPPWSSPSRSWTTRNRVMATRSTLVLLTAAESPFRGRNIWLVTSELTIRRLFSFVKSAKGNSIEGLNLSLFFCMTVSFPLRSRSVSNVY
jgi:hypothetical protein